MRHGNPILLLLLLLLESNIDRHDGQEGPTAYFLNGGIKSKLCLPGPLYRQTDVLLCVDQTQQQQQQLVVTSIVQ